MFKKYFNFKENPNIPFLLVAIVFVIVAFTNQDWTFAALAVVFLALSINK